MYNWSKRERLIKFGLYAEIAYMKLESLVIGNHHVSVNNTFKLCTLPCFIGSNLFESVKVCWNNTSTQQPAASMKPQQQPTREETWAYVKKHDLQARLNKVNLALTLTRL